jgi:hypothetical protein
MKIYLFLIVSCLLFAFTGCFNEQDLTFDEFKLVEFEQAVTTAPTTSVGATFPILTATRVAGTQNLQVNLVGTQFEDAQTLTFSIDTTINNYLKVYNATTVNTIRAEAGVHFDLKGATFSIDKATSKGTLSFDIKDPGANTGKFALFVIKLDGNDRIKPSENHRRLGFRVNLN